VPVAVRLNRIDQPVPHSLQVAGVIGIGSVRIPQDRGARRGVLEVYTIQQDAAGNVLHQVTEQQYQTYLRSGILFRQFVEPTPAATVLRVLVQAPGSSEVGCVIVPLAKFK
jgi:hypothetical protein